MNVGDRVLRRTFPWEGLSPRRGVVTEVYQSKMSHIGYSVTLYAVRWDDTKVEERGYLENGLELEPLSLGGL